jgi:flagellar basal-body rod modification protein FlgD
MTSITNNSFDSLGFASNVGVAPPQLGQQEFLELMITQLKNQDPFKPLASGEFLGQIAQFSTVAGVQDLQASFAQVAGALYSSQALQASSLVGRTVLVPSAQAELTAGASLSGAVELPVGASEVTVGLYDQNGELVKTITLGQQAGGVIPFSWDGLTDAGTLAAPGLYEMKATARFGGDEVAVGTLASAKVNGVTLGGYGGGITLNLGNLGDIDFAWVRQIM